MDLLMDASWMGNKGDEMWVRLFGRERLEIGGGEWAGVRKKVGDYWRRCQNFGRI